MNINKFLAILLLLSVAYTSAMKRTRDYAFRQEEEKATPVITAEAIDAVPAITEEAIHAIPVTAEVIEAMPVITEEEKASVANKILLKLLNSKSINEFEEQFQNLNEDQVLGVYNLVDKPLDDSGRTHLYSAVLNRNLIAIEILKRLRANPNVKDQVGRTPLHTAAQLFPESIIKLIEIGTDVNAKNHKGNTALMYAARFNPSAIQPLVEARADVNAKDNVGWTPLMFAAKYNPASIQPLVQAGADVNAKGNLGGTPLMFAARYNTTGIQPLIAARANVNAKDNEGWIPLMFAAQYMFQQFSL